MGSQRVGHNWVTNTFTFMFISYVSSFQKEYQAAYKKIHSTGGHPIWQERKMKPDVGGIHSTPLPGHLPAVGFRFSLELFTSQWMITLRDSVSKRQKQICCFETQNNSLYWDFQFSSVTQSCPTLCDPHGLQHARLPCPSLTPRVYSNSCPLSRWCHPTISSPVVPFSSCLQSFPPSGSFQMSQLFTSGAKVLELQFQHQSFQWIFRTGLF